ncbi:hypothetical protein Halru_1396 [Halovivax ruber XH-70]|uniref:Uncharacterized protein n=1 Tax=Halovivax ruber (strain DSM 18193 / JCM 13892 / XH-70) TaxID=797302 RepID=L0IB77_HALRX|nr:hypothetical protein [Halovivax ruber]AGB16009.1 hypothetical protein Halru_1396 [Halovivax ruber XH-70]
MLLSGRQVGGLAELPATPLSDQQTVVDFYMGVSPVVRIALVVGAILVVGITVLGLLPEYSRRTIVTARRSPVISILIGIPTTLVFGALAYIGLLLSHSDIGVFFAIPLVTLCLALLPTWALIAIVSTGNGLSGRFLRDSVGVGLVVGALVVGMSAVHIIPLLAVTGFVICYGAGAGVRVLISGGAASDPADRSVPPANKI